MNDTTKALLSDIAKLAFSCTEENLSQDYWPCIEAIQDRLRQSGRLIGSRYRVLGYEVYTDD